MVDGRRSGCRQRWWFLPLPSVADAGGPSGAAGRGELRMGASGPLAASAPHRVARVLRQEPLLFVFFFRIAV